MHFKDIVAFIEEVSRPSQRLDSLKATIRQNPKKLR